MAKRLLVIALVMIGILVIMQANAQEGPRVYLDQPEYNPGGDEPLHGPDFVSPSDNQDYGGQPEGAAGVEAGSYYNKPERPTAGVLSEEGTMPTTMVGKHCAKKTAKPFRSTTAPVKTTVVRAKTTIARYRPPAWAKIIGSWQAKIAALTRGQKRLDDRMTGLERHDKQQTKEIQTHRGMLSDHQKAIRDLRNGQAGLADRVDKLKNSEADGNQDGRDLVVWSVIFVVLLIAAIGAGHAHYANRRSERLERLYTDRRGGERQ